MFYGIINLDNRPISPEDIIHLCQLDQAKQSSNWQSTNLFLGQISNSRQGILNYKCFRKDIVLVGNIRLDNRTELHTILIGYLPQKAFVSDNDLLVSAYLKWGTQCVEHLLGDWVFALWDKEKQSLFLAREHFGTSSLYYCQQKNTLFFATSLKLLCKLPNILLRVNTLGLGIGGAGFVTDARSTPYQHVLRLTPGQALLASTKGVHVYCYWQLQSIQPVQYSSDDYLDVLIELLTKAVRCRLDSSHQNGIFLSSGLDSTSIAAIASPILEQRNQRLYAYSAYPAYDVQAIALHDRETDERHLVKQLCTEYPTIDIQFINGQSIPILAAIKQVGDILHFPLANGNASWILAILNQAKSDGVKQLFDGWGGNFTVSWNGNRALLFKEMLYTGQIKTYFNYLRTRPHHNMRKFMQSLCKDIIQTISPQMLASTRKNHVGRLAFFSPHIIKKLQQDRTVLRIDPNAEQFTVPGLYHYYRNGLTELNSVMAHAFGIETAQPLIDKRIIDFCIGIQQDQFLRDGKDRMLIRRAMHDRLPYNLLYSKSRGLQGWDSALRLYAERQAVDQVLHRFQQSPTISHYLNIPKIQQYWLQIKQAPKTQQVVMPAFWLIRGLSIGFFLERFETYGY